MEQTRKPRQVALFVGVNKYADNSFRDLRFSVPDAKALAEAFNRQGYETKVLEDPKANEVLDEVGQLSSDLGPEDVFLFFFAGHGFTSQEGKHLLICNDDRLDYLRYNRAGIPVELLEDRTNGKGFHRAFLLDACRTDIFSGMAERGGETRNLALISMPDAKENPGTCSVLRSCDRFCPALEFEDIGHGVFTQAVLELMNDNEARTLPFGETFVSSIRGRMRKILQVHRIFTDQTPVIQSNGDPFLLFPSTMAELKKWLEKDLRDCGFIDEDLCDDCKACLNGRHGKPLQQAVMQICRTFSCESPAHDSEAAGKTAAKLLKAICSSIVEIDDLQRNVNELKKALLEEPHAKGRDEPFAQPSQLLDEGKSHELQMIAEGVQAEWRRKEAIGAALDAMREARTAQAALNALRALNDAIRDEFINKNYRKYERTDSRLERLPYLFSISSNAWQRVLKDRAYAAGTSEIDKALSTLSRLATSCYELRRY